MLKETVNINSKFIQSISVHVCHTDMCFRQTGCPAATAKGNFDKFNF
jgi:hypothetical protein